MSQRWFKLYTPAVLAVETAKEETLDCACKTDAFDSTIIHMRRHSLDLRASKRNLDAS